MAVVGLQIEDWHSLLGVEDMQLPDGIVIGTSFDTWSDLLIALHDSPWAITFRRDAVRPPPYASKDLFDDPLWVIGIELPCGAIVNIFPLAPDSIDFDFCLAEIQHQDDLDDLLEFVRFLGQTCHRDVSLRYEGSDIDFAGYEFVSDEFFLQSDLQPLQITAKQSSRILNVGEERVRYERRRLLVLGARLRGFRNHEIGLKQLNDSTLPLLEEQTMLPEFWRDAAYDAWAELDVDFALAWNGSSPIPNFSDSSVPEKALELETLVEEGKRRLELLDGPLKRFAFTNPFQSWREAAEQLPIGCSIQGTITEMAAFGFFVDINVPFFGLVHRPDQERAARLTVGDSVRVTVVGFEREKLQLNFI
jgi:S1 RNA binding domain